MVFVILVQYVCMYVIKVPRADAFKDRPAVYCTLFYGFSFHAASWQSREQ